MVPPCPALARIGTAVAYLMLRNEGSAPVRVFGASTPIAESVEIHESSMENNVARMQPRPDGVVVPLGGTVRFQPGSLHLMLAKPHADLKAAQSFTLWFLIYLLLCPQLAPALMPWRAASRWLSSR